MDTAIRLDLGAGHKKYPGWITVDCATERKKVVGHDVTADSAALNPDVVCDLRTLPFPNDCADEARAIHVIEHFYPWEAAGLLREWVRVIKPGGTLTLECPCLEKILKLFEVPNMTPDMTYWGLYGDPRYKDPLMMHKWCYGRTQLARTMENAGLMDIQIEPAKFHQPLRDMRLVGVKPIPESRIEIAH